MVYLFPRYCLFFDTPRFLTMKGASALLPSFFRRHYIGAVNAATAAATSRRFDYHTLTPPYI